MLVTRRTIEWKPLLFFFLYTFILAGIGILLSGSPSTEGLTMPPLAPPDWLFPVVWTILYSLMSVAAYLVFVSGDIDRGPALRLYLLQVLVNILWPLFFFRFEWYFFSFLWLLLLLTLVIFTALRFKLISRTAYLLFLPYIAWLLIAGYLNLGIYLLNR
ncbi:MAG: tryptophan-rich sensory protein [Clostridia bacterium]|nr:tryptophan-rich sensory protein [Clostridia bacterium]